MRHNKAKDKTQCTNYSTYELTLMSINLIKLRTRNLKKEKKNNNVKTNLN
jgi:hypothetical protein